MGRLKERLVLFGLCALALSAEAFKIERVFTELSPGFLTLALAVQLGLVHTLAHPSADATLVPPAPVLGTRATRHVV